MSDRAAFPYALAPNGQTARAGRAEFLTQMFEQILFVTPGERVNRPEFGCSLRGLTFAAGPNELTPAIEALAQSALRQWVGGDTIQIHGLDISVQDSRVQVNITYLDLTSQLVRQTSVFG